MRQRGTEPGAHVQYTLTAYFVFLVICFGHNMNCTTWTNSATHSCSVNKVQCLEKSSASFSSCPKDSPRFLLVTPILFPVEGSWPELLPCSRVFGDPFHSQQTPNQFHTNFLAKRYFKTLHIHPAYRIVKIG